LLPCVIVAGCAIGVAATTLVEVATGVVVSSSVLIGAVGVMAVRCACALSLSEMSALNLL